MDARTLAKTIADQVDIVKVIERDVVLKHTGKNYRGLCPFHQEKTPSFFVHPQRKRFFCYGCHEGGDVVRFVQMARGLSFKEACEALIADFQLPIQMGKLGSSAPRQDTEALYRVQDFAARFYHSRLSKAPEVLTYLQSRKITPQALDHFQLGTSAWENRDVFYMALKKQAAQQKNEQPILHAAEQVGLWGKRGSVPEDKFFKRLMFPIRSIRGKVVGFGSRTLSDAKDIPKYLNSPESAVFAKRDVLYGFYENFEAIRKQRELFLVEGYFDVIKLWQHGIQNVCATLGTSLSESWVSRLKKSLKKLTIIFDGDEAGLRAMVQIADFFFSHQWEPYVLVLPDGLDPDEFLDQRGPDAFHALIKQEAKRYFDFYFIQRFHEVKSSYFDLMALMDHLAQVLVATSPLSVALSRMEGYLGVADLGHEVRTLLLARMKQQARKTASSRPSPQERGNAKVHAWLHARQDWVRLFQIALYDPAFIGKMQEKSRNILKEKEFCDLLTHLGECVGVLETIPQFEDRVQFVQYSTAPSEGSEEFFQAVLKGDTPGVKDPETREQLFEQTVQRVVQKQASQVRKMKLLAFKQRYRDGNMSWDQVVEALEQLQGSSDSKKSEVSGA